MKRRMRRMFVAGAVVTALSLLATLAEAGVVDKETRRQRRETKRFLQSIGCTEVPPFCFVDVVDPARAWRKRNLGLYCLNLPIRPKFSAIFPEAE